MKITSAQNPRIRSLIKLKKKRERDHKKQFLVEGYREITFAPKLLELYICPSFFIGENESQLIQKLQSQGVKVFELSPDLFQKVAYRERPDGLLGLAPHLSITLADLENKPPFFIVAEGIEKPGNLGTILRTADAAGVSAVFVCDRTTDIHNPNVVRSSVGSLFTVPVIEVSNEEARSFLRGLKVQLLAATPHATKSYTEVSLNQPLAILMGTEQYGLSEFWMNEADLQVKIPMHGKIDSLNVAQATSILLFEAVRQQAINR